MTSSDPPDEVSSQGLRLIRNQPRPSPEEEGKPSADEVFAENLPPLLSETRHSENGLPHAIPDARVLIVEDDEAVVRFLQTVLRHVGVTRVQTVLDPRRVLSVCTEFNPDLILLDLHLPYLSGFEVLHQIITRTPPDTYLPVLILTGDSTPEAMQRAFSEGAKDFVTKPFHPNEVMLRVRNLLETRFLHLQLQHQNQVLEAKIRDRTRELEEAQIEILERLALTAEYRDDQTGDHFRRVGQLSGLLAKELGLPHRQVELIQKAALLHDLGKVSVPDQILLKPDKLLPEEFERVKPHTTTGAKILSGSRSPLLQLAEEIALYHHERWDGAGYVGLQRDAIPLPARIVAVADTFDVLTHHRPYRGAWPVEKAITELRSQSGSQFDPRIVVALCSVLSRQETPKPHKVGEAAG